MARGGYGVRLDLVPVSKLKPHEDTIESNTREMVAQLKRDGAQKDPLIVDSNTGVVLDGMHRLSAFVKLGLGFAACDLVNYEAENIKVGRWLRVYNLPEKESPRLILQELGLTQRFGVTEGVRMLEERKVLVAAFAGEAAYTSSTAGDVRESFEMLRGADALAQFHRWSRTFEREEDLGRHAADPSVVALLVARFDKEEVVSAGTSGRLLPCKTSMHIVDPRPVAVNMPIDELKTGSRRSLDKLLEEDKFKILPPGYNYEGRRYKERLLLLSGG